MYFVMLVIIAGWGGVLYFLGKLGEEIYNTGRSKKNEAPSSSKCVMCKNNITSKTQSTKTKVPCHEWCETYY